MLTLTQAIIVIALVRSSDCCQPRVKDSLTPSKSLPFPNRPVRSAPDRSLCRGSGSRAVQNGVATRSSNPNAAPKKMAFTVTVAEHEATWLANRYVQYHRRLPGVVWPGRDLR